MKTHNKPSLHYGIIVLALIVLAVFSALGLARFGYTSILPAMQESLQLSNTQTGELQTLNLIGYLVAVVFAGMLAARFGPRIVISISLLIVGISMILTGLFPPLPPQQQAASWLVSEARVGISLPWGWFHPGSERAAAALLQVSA